MLEINGDKICAKLGQKKIQDTVLVQPNGSVSCPSSNLVPCATKTSLTICVEEGKKETHCPVTDV